MASETKTELTIEQCQDILSDHESRDFMVPQVTVKAAWVLVHDAASYPESERWIMADDMEDEDVATEQTIGYGARYSAPGYLDCTEWTVFDTEAEAMRFLAEDLAELDAQTPTE